MKQSGKETSGDAAALQLTVPWLGTLGCLQGCPCPTEEMAFELQLGPNKPDFAPVSAIIHVERVQTSVQEHLFKIGPKAGSVPPAQKSPRPRAEEEEPSGT